MPDPYRKSATLAFFFLNNLESHCQGLIVLVVLLHLLAARQDGGRGPAPFLRRLDRKQQRLILRAR